MVANHFGRKILLLAIVCSIIAVELVPVLCSGGNLKIMGIEIANPLKKNKEEKSRESEQPLALEYPKSGGAKNKNQLVLAPQMEAQANKAEASRARNNKQVLALEGSKQVGSLYGNDGGFAGGQQLVVAPKPKPRPLGSEEAIRQRANKQQLALEGAKSQANLALYGSDQVNTGTSQLVVALKPKARPLMEQLPKPKKRPENNKLALAVSQGGPSLFGPAKVVPNNGQQVVVAPKPRLRQEYRVEPPAPEPKPKKLKKPKQQQQQQHQQQLNYHPQYQEEETAPSYEYPAEVQPYQPRGYWSPEGYAEHSDNGYAMPQYQEAPPAAAHAENPTEEGAKKMVGHTHSIDFEVDKDCSHILGEFWYECNNCCYPADSDPFGSYCTCHRATRHYTTWLEKPI